MIFSNDSVTSSEMLCGPRPSRQGPSPEEKAEVWLQNIGDISVIPNLDSVMKAKSQAQELFNAQQVSDWARCAACGIALFIFISIFDRTSHLEALCGQCCFSMCV